MIRINLAKVLQCGLEHVFVDVVNRQDDSVVILSKDRPIIDPQRPTTVLPLPLILSLFDFRNTTNDVMTQDWVATLRLEQSMGLTTPQKLLELAWLGVQQKNPHLDWKGKAQQLGYEVQEHSGEMEQGCFCVFLKTKPKVYRYKRIDNVEASGRVDQGE
jgi:hypothetical protein